MNAPHRPKVEMLWEARDPADVLTTRFGFHDRAGAGQWIATVLNEHWDVRVDTCERIVMSDHNALAWVTTLSGRMLAKWSVHPERFPRLAALARLTHWLDGIGLPVSAPIPALDGRLQIEIDGASLGLQRHIAGDLLDATDHAQIRTSGAALARLHDALAEYPDADQVSELVSPPMPLAARVNDWLDSGSEHVPARARDTLRQLVADADTDTLPAQIVHGDFRSANVLYVGANVAAVIDFEEARFDHRIDELARSAVLLGTRFHNWGPVSSQVHSSFLTGYQSQRRLTATEASWWNVLVLWYALAMVPAGADPTGWKSAAMSLVFKH